MSKETQVLEFSDTDLVRKMCGPNHANLALIEEAFGVYIEAPGTSVHINGDGPSIARAGELIKEVYQHHGIQEQLFYLLINGIRVLVKQLTID